jgi:hypothetical protein
LNAESGERMAIEECRPSQGTGDDPIAVERAALLNAYKRRAKQTGIKLTDTMIAKAAKATWNTRTPVTWWKRNDPGTKPSHDRLIRGVLAKDPSSLWPVK